MEEMLTLLDQRKGAIIGVVLTLRSHKLPNEGMLVNKRGTKKPNLVPTIEIYPQGVYHLVKQQVMLATNYAAAVERQRGKEALAYMESLPTPPKFMPPPSMPEIPEFIPEEMWGGKGERDQDFFPRFIVRHKDHGGRYLSYRPHDGKPLLSEWYDVATGNKLDKEADLKDFLPPPKADTSKAQGTDKLIRWEVCKLGNVQSFGYDDELYEIIPAREPAGV
jgi:hypothetical protein